MSGIWGWPGPGTRADDPASAAGISATAAAPPASETRARERSQLDEAFTLQAAADADARASALRVRALSEQAQGMAGQYRQLQSEADSLERYNRQLESQLLAQRTELDTTRRQLEEISETQRDILPLIGRMVDTLEKFVALDVPFLGDERQARVQGIRALLDRTDVSVSEKYRRIMEAYQIEAEYGRTLDSYEGSLPDAASGDARTAVFVRIGRIALLYRTPDRSEVGYWDVRARRFTAEPAIARAFEETLRVAKKQGAPELLIVPIPAPGAEVPADPKSRVESREVRS